MPYERINISFYEQINRETVYAAARDCREHAFYPLLLPFVEQWDLRNKKCLEIGSSKGLFQDIVDDYTGVDIADSLRFHYHKPYHVVYDARLPFPDRSFDAVFTYATHEHIPEIETALEEIVRVLKPGGVCLFAPAWHTRSWFSEGIAVRPYADLTTGQKITKILIPVRDFALIRWSSVFVRRAVRLIQYLLTATREMPLQYKKLNANYETFWQSDSDACNSLDPFDVIIWFKRRGFICHGYESNVRALVVRSCYLQLQKPFSAAVPGDGTQ